MAHEVIYRLDLAQESRALSPLELQLRCGLKKRLLGLASLERTIARQHARMADLKDGDANAQFFRIYAVKRSRRNHITVLTNGDMVARSLEEKVDLATEFFVELLGRPVAREHDISLQSLDLPLVDLSGLESRFAEEEVWAAIRSMPANRSPGPDGFSWAFFRCCWPVVKGDVMDAMHAVFVGRDQAFRDLNTTFLSLVPKTEGATAMKDFRPISLVHCFAKLVAKTLALRLAPRMPELVHACQSAFIGGRSIQDNFVLVRSSAAALHQRRSPALLLKLDIAKAFDSVSWSFLLSVLRQRGFGPRWIRWITMFPRSASSQVLVNGDARDAFLHGRGLRQGDPLPPCSSCSSWMSLWPCYVRRNGVTCWPTCRA
jgi:hypothetical protein